MENTPEQKPARTANKAAPSEKEKANKVIGRYGTIGLEIFFAILLGYIFGFYLDKWIGTAPYITIVFTLYGVVAAIRALVRLTKMYKEDLLAQDKAEKDKEVK
jgi:ATP synthase protein I